MKLIMRSFNLLNSNFIKFYLIFLHLSDQVLTNETQIQFNESIANHTQLLTTTQSLPHYAAIHQRSQAKESVGLVAMASVFLMVGVIGGFLVVGKSKTFHIISKISVSPKRLEISFLLCFVKL